MVWFYSDIRKHSDPLERICQDWIIYCIWQYTKRTKWTCELLCMYEKNLKSNIGISIQGRVAVMTAGGVLRCDSLSFAHLDAVSYLSLQIPSNLSAWLWKVWLCPQYFYGVVLAGILKDSICPKAIQVSSWLCAPGHSDTEWRIFSLDRGCVQVFFKDHSIFGSIQPLLCCLPILKPVAENNSLSIVSLQLHLLHLYAYGALCCYTLFNSYKQFFIRLNDQFLK